MECGWPTSQDWARKTPIHAGSLPNSAIARGWRPFIPNRIATQSITGMSLVETGGRSVKPARYYSQYLIGARPEGELSRESIAMRRALAASTFAFWAGWRGVKLCVFGNQE